jgi:hypothetical protein
MRNKTPDKEQQICLDNFSEETFSTEPFFQRTQFDQYFTQKQSSWTMKCPLYARLNFPKDKLRKILNENK